MNRLQTLKIPGWSSLLLINVFSSFSYYGLRAVLLLYLMQTLNIDYQRSLEIFAAFISLHFVTQVLCGWLSDRYIGNQKGIWIGGVLFLIGGIFSLFSGSLFNFSGIVCFILGTSLNHVNIIALFGKLHEKKEQLTESSFTFLKVGAEMSLFCASVLLSSFFEIVDWKNIVLLICAFSGVLSSGLAYLLRHQFGYHGIKPSVASEIESGRGGDLFTVLFFLLTGFVCAFLLWDNTWLEVLVPVFMAASIAVAFQVALIKKFFPSMMVVLVLFIFNILFISLFYHASSLWVLFVNGNIDRSLSFFEGTVFSGFQAYSEVPLVFLKTLNSFFVVLLGIGIAFLWRYNSFSKKLQTPFSKLALGFCCTAISFSILALSKQYASEEGVVSVAWFFGSHFFYALGELMILPIMLAYLARVVPRENITFLIGMWLMSGAISIYANKYFTNLFIFDSYKPLYNSIESLNQYSDAFGVLSWVSFLIALIAFVLSFVFPRFLEKNIKEQ